MKYYLLIRVSGLTILGKTDRTLLASRTNTKITNRAGDDAVDAGGKGPSKPYWLASNGLIIEKFVAGVMPGGAWFGPGFVQDRFSANGTFFVRIDGRFLRVRVRGTPSYFSQF